METDKRRMVENVVEHSKFVDIMPPKIIHLSVQREMISVRRSLSIIRNGTLSVLTVRWTRRFLRISCEVLPNAGDMSVRRRNSIWMVYIYILLIGCRQEAASSIVRMLLGNIGCTEAGVTISLAGNWNVRSSISVMP